MSRSRRPVLRALRTLPERWHRPLAKTLSRAAGHLSRIRTYQRYYVAGETTDPTGLVFGGWHWSTCAMSSSLLEMSMQLDWDHWDCWALRHDDCDPQPCTVCGGCRCADWPPEEDA